MIQTIALHTRIIKQLYGIIFMLKLDRPVDDRIVFTEFRDSPT